MMPYFAQRLAAVAGVITLMSVLVFLATHALPATIAEVMLGQYATPETVAALETKLGLTRPLLTQYWEWASGVLRGDLGRSLVMEVPIAPVLWTALGRSAVLGAAAMTVVSVLGIALGVVAAVRRGRVIDHLASGFTIVGLSVPEFFWGLLLILLFGSYLQLLPTSGYGTLDQGARSYIAHLVLPVATLTIGLLAHIARLTRSSMLEALDTAYVKAARARGLPEWAVVTRHALRNALLPTITVLAQDVGFLIGGIVAVETIFAYPGIGRLLVYALERHDLPLMEAAILVLTAVQCFANLAADLLYAFFNPQIRYGRAVA
jgi:peptide/nickel transport system permease protein